jgi:hypothetical protein
MLKAKRNKGKFQLAKAATVMGLVSSWLLYGAALNGEAGHGALI